MKKPTLAPFYMLMFTEVMASNMVHPVTPSFLTALGMPDQMFGVAFAAMSLTNFWLCPFWGRVGDLYSRVKTMNHRFIRRRSVLVSSKHHCLADPSGPALFRCLQRRDHRMPDGLWGGRRGRGALR